MADSNPIAVVVPVERPIAIMAPAAQGLNGPSASEEWLARPENAGKTYDDFIRMLAAGSQLVENQW